MQDIESLSIELLRQNHDARHISRRAGMAQGEARLYGVIAEGDDRHCLRRLGRSTDGVWPNSYYGVWFVEEQLSRKSLHRRGITHSFVQDEVMTLPEAEICKLRQRRISGDFQGLGRRCKLSEAVHLPDCRLGSN